ncbi:MAG TPA: SOS response-associated peptidase, partial [Verrucomicrobiae bacterium]|nr:SOS response-associated peptidase [Verrucomicrobiae bacterium]
CLVPVDGFYEWQRVGSRRQPYLIARSDGRPLALAGLWSGWHDPAADRVLRTFTIVTAGPNAQVGRLHDRMPVIVDELAWAIWLDTSLDDPAELQGLLQPNEGVDLRIVPVSRLVNDVRNDGPELIEPAPEALAVAEPEVVAPGLFD